MHPSSPSSSSPAPGRPREFEVDAAVESAMQVFWTKGYNGTSLVDLIDGTGLSRGSLYKAFGDKRGLFLVALDRYAAGATAYLTEALHKPASARAAIHGVLMNFVRLSTAEEGLRGCLMVATATEMVPHDEGVAECVRALFERMRKAYAATIARGQAQGEIPAGHDADALARLLVCLTQGMRAVGKTGATKKDMTAVVNTAMTLLD